MAKPASRNFKNLLYPSLFGAALIAALPLNALAEFYPERAVCTTESYGLRFQAESYDIAQAFDDVIDDCQYDSRTDLDECASNVVCSSADSDRYQRSLINLMEGTYRTTNCSSCYLQVIRYGNQLYADMAPWERSGSYSGGQEPMFFVGPNTVQYRGDRFSVSVYRDQVELRNISGGGGRNVEMAIKMTDSRVPYPTPRPVPVPRPRPRPIPAPRAPRPVPLPARDCPPGTVYDASIGRCVSRATPPRPAPVPVRRR